MLAVYLIGIVLVFVSFLVYTLYDLKPWKDTWYQPNWPRWTTASFVCGICWPLVALYIVCMGITKSLDSVMVVLSGAFGKLFPRKRRKTS